MSYNAVNSFIHITSNHSHLFRNILRKLPPEPSPPAFWETKMPYHFPFKLQTLPPGITCIHNCQTLHFKFLHWTVQISGIHKSEDLFPSFRKLLLPTSFFWGEEKLFYIGQQICEPVFRCSALHSLELLPHLRLHDKHNKDDLTIQWLYHFK